MADTLPPEVVGDPAGMRELAATLRAEADRLGALGDSVGTVASTTEFVAPAADRYRDDVGESRAALGAPPRSRPARSRSSRHKRSGRS